jgi:hypothetical protein
MNLWTIVVWTFEAFIFVASIFLLIWIFTDLYRDHKLAVVWKVLWTIFLVFVPLLAALIYLIARGRGMAERYAARQVQPAREEDAYTPQASSSPAEDIAQAKKLLDSGAISQGEFDAIKSKALGNKYYG